MFNNFLPFKFITQNDPEVIIHGLKSTTTSSSPLPALLLLHGFPQSHHIWHRIAPHLTTKYTIIMIDIRGYGASSKPSHVSSYTKTLMAQDCISVIDQLNIDTFFLCAHDRGARVAHKLCVDHPSRVTKAILLDICPTLTMYSSTNLDFAKAYYHWFFLIQNEPLPETLVSGNPRLFASVFMGSRQSGGVEIFEKECFEYYVQMLGDLETVHGMCQDYRASATLDLEEAREDLESGRLVQSPLMVLWGSRGVIERCFDALKEWRAVTGEEVEVRGRSVDCGHYIPEEAPDEVVSAIEEFFV